MPLTRRSITKKEEAQELKSPKPSGRGKRGAKRGEASAEEAAVEEPQESPPAKRGRQAAKDEPKADTQKGRGASRGSTRSRGKQEVQVQEEPDTEVTPARGGRSRSARGQTTEPRSSSRAKGKQVAAVEKEEEEEEEEDEEPVETETKKSRQGRVKVTPSPQSKRGGRRGKAEEKAEEDVSEEPKEEVVAEKPKRGGRRGKVEEDHKEDVNEDVEVQKGKAKRGGRRSKAASEEIHQSEEEEEPKVDKEPSPQKAEETPVTPSSGGRRSGGRARKTPEVSAKTPPARSSRRGAAAASPVETAPEPKSEKKSEATSEDLQALAAGAQNVPLPPEKVEEDSPLAEESVSSDVKTGSQKRKLEDDSPIKSSPKKQRISDSSPVAMEASVVETGSKVDLSVPSAASKDQNAMEVDQQEVKDLPDGSSAPASTAEAVQTAVAERLSDGDETVSQENEAAKTVANEAAASVVGEDTSSEKEVDGEKVPEKVAVVEEMSEKVPVEQKVEANVAAVVNVPEEKKDEDKDKESKLAGGEEIADKLNEGDDVAAPEVEETTSKAEDLLAGGDEVSETRKSVEGAVEDVSQSTEASKEDDDFVVINKEDVPAPDSKEVAEALPPDHNEKPTAREVDTPNPMKVPSDLAAPEIIVPLTEAELGKQYNPTMKDRDETSSTMVEVGSEAAMDITGVSDVTTLDNSSTEPPAEAVSQHESSTTEPIKEQDTMKFPTDPSKISPEPTECLPPPPVTAVPAAVATTTAAAAATSSSTVSSAAVSVPIQPEATPISNPVGQSNQQQTTPSVPGAGVNSTASPKVVANSGHAGTASSSQPAPPPPPPPRPVEIPKIVVTQNGDEKPSTDIPSAPVKMSTPFKPLPRKTSSENYVPSSPAIDKRKFIGNPSFPVELMDPAFWFSVVSYNILADCHLRRYNYSYTDPQHLEQDYRHNLLIKEIDYLNGDIVCMQEVNPDYYSRVLIPAMKSRGYQGVFIKRTKPFYDEGEATFVRTSKFEILSHEGTSLKDLAYKEVDAANLSEEVSQAAKKALDCADVILVCKLLSKKTGKILTVCNIHVVYTQQAPDLQCVQVASAIKDLVSKAGNDLNPHIICGDFNSEVTSPAYHLAKEGYLSDVHIQNLQAIQSMDNTDGSSRSLINHLWRAFQHTSSNLKSAYETAVGKEPLITSLNTLTNSALDYIFHSASSIDTVGVLEVLDPQVVEAAVGLPSRQIPSDHLSMKAVFRLKDSIMHAQAQ